MRYNRGVSARPVPYALALSLAAPPVKVAVLPVVAPDLEVTDRLHLAAVVRRELDALPELAVQPADVTARNLVVGERG